MRLQLVSLDVLQALGVLTDDEFDEEPVLAPAAALVDLVPAHVVVTSCSVGADGVVADDVGVRLADQYRIDLVRRLRRANSTGAAAEIVAVELEDDTTEQLLVLGLGDGGPVAAREAGARLAERIRGSEVVLCDVGATLSRESFRAFCEGLLLASHRFTRKSGDHQPKPLLVQLAVPSVASAQPTLDRALATARAVCLARDLGNRPSNSKSPAWVAVEARRVGKESGFRVRVIDQAGLERGGFGGLTAVGAGSANPPQLVIMDYQGGAGGPHVVLVGKGITFDSGGLCLKPADGMPLMKTDMAGAAAVLGVMSALRDLDVGVDVTGVLACAENMPGASAYRPSDVVRHFGGRTSEVVDTDAEGRLVLADALAYAAARLSPDVVIDIATLTGAATMALSRSMGALYTQDDGLAAALQAAGVSSNDRLWRMPLVVDYRSALDSSVADISHVARTDVGAGSITAALFLQEFVAGVRWAHLDIAGPGRAEAPRAELARGATGFGARVLLRWLEGAPDLW